MDPITNTQEITLPTHQNVRFNTDTWSKTLDTTNKRIINLYHLIFYSEYEP
jgi:hypothetical protein